MIWKMVTACVLAVVLGMAGLAGAVPLSVSVNQVETGALDEPGVWVSWAWSAAVNNIGSKVITQWKDLNGDGDFADANEQITIVSNVGSSCTAAPNIWACSLTTSAFELNTVKIRDPGSIGTNFTLVVQARNAVNTVIDAMIVSWQSAPTGRAEAQGTRALINSTAPTDQIPQHEATRALVNQSYANATQNLTVHNQTVHDHLDVHNVTQDHDFPPHGAGNASACDASCQANISESVVQNLTLSEGGDTFILGHTQDLVLNSEARLVLVLLATGFLVWLTTRPGNIWSVLAMLGALGLFAFILTHYADITASPATNAMLLALPLLVFVIAPMRIMFGTGADSTSGVNEEAEDY